MREGTFVHPGQGVTFFVGRITESGLLEEIFLEDSRSETQTTTYTAERALFLRDGDQAQLVMLGGVAQSLSKADGTYSVTRFSDFVFDVTPFIGEAAPPRRSSAEYTTPEIIGLLRAGGLEPPLSAHALKLQSHDRIAQSLLTPGAALLGFAALLVGGFSRFGLWRQIALAIGLAVLIKGVDNNMLALVRRQDLPMIAVYAGSAMTFLCAGVLLWLAAHPGILTRSRRSGRIAAGATP